MKTVTLVSAVGHLFLFSGVVLHIVGMATPYFAVMPDCEARRTLIKLGRNVSLVNSVEDDIGVNYGLWVFCVKGGNPLSLQGCHQMGSSRRVDSPDWMTPVKALSIVGLIVSVLGEITIWVRFCIMRADEKSHYMYLAFTAACSIVAGVFILAGDITFAADNSIAFFANRNIDNFFFASGASASQRAYEIQSYDHVLRTGYSFILDLTAGSLCILAGPAFIYMALRLYWKKQDERKRKALEQSMKASARNPYFTHNKY